MLKWSPKPFDVEPAAAAGPDPAPAPFEALATGGDAQDTGARLFRSESGFVDARALMTSLTQDERSQVYELVQLDLEEEYKERAAARDAEHETRLAAVQAEAAARFDHWTGAIATALATEVREAAAASARLAVEIAGKIVRQVVAIDPTVVARTIETTLFKLTENAPLTIQAQPDEAAWLEGQPGLRERLNIERIVADRRVEAGGCIVRSAGREWDATLARQLDTIAEIVAEAIATAAGEATPLAPAAGPGAGHAEPENDHDPALD